MAVISTKYSVGDIVYHACIATERKQHPCPDCKGEKRWKAISPAGGEYNFSCPRCSAQFNSDRDLTLDYSAFAPRVGKLTIGSIQVNTAETSYDHGNRYMCRETGIGSGTVYNETDLFPTEEEASAAAKIKAALQTSSTEWMVKLYDKSLSVSDYQLENAALNKAKDEQSRARSLLWNIGDLFEKIEAAEDKDEILEAVNDYKNYDWSRDKQSAKEAEPA